MGSTILTMKTLTHKIVIYSCLFLVGAWAQPVSLDWDKLPQSAMFDTIFKSDDTTKLVDSLFHMAIKPMKCVIETVDQKEFDKLLIETGIDKQGESELLKTNTNKTTPVMDKLDKHCGTKVNQAKTQMTTEI